MTQCHYKQAFKNIKDEGIPWDVPATLVIKPYNIKSCWVPFFKLCVFSQILGAMIDSNQKPSCPNCGNLLTKNVHGFPFRLVFDQTNNHQIKAPN